MTKLDTATLRAVLDMIAEMPACTDADWRYELECRLRLAAAPRPVAEPCNVSQAACTNLHCADHYQPTPPPPPAEAREGVERPDGVVLAIGDVVMFGGRLEPPRFLQLTTDYECRRWSGRLSDITAVLRPVWRRPK